jgi:hypothetical protein
MPIVLLLLLSLALLSACGSDKQEQTGGIPYSSKEMRFSLVLPESWEGKYVVEETDDEVLFRSKSNLSWGGVVFQIRAWDKAEWEKDGEEMMKMTHIVKVGEQGNTVFSLSTPSDVQSDINNPEKKQEYSSMHADIPLIQPSFTTLNPS